MLRSAAAGAGSVRLGIVFIVVSFALFSLHDAAFKLIVVDYSVPQILFVRSVMAILACLAMRAAQPGEATFRRRRSPSLTAPLRSVPDSPCVRPPMPEDFSGQGKTRCQQCQTRGYASGRETVLRRPLQMKAGGVSASISSWWS